MTAPVHKQERGNVLIAALVVGLVVGVTLIGYLSWAHTQNRLIMRSQQWNAALPLAEAGLEEAMTHLATGSSNKINRGWTLQGGFLTKQRSLGDGYYLVKIGTNPLPDILSEGFVKAPLQNNQHIARKVLVTTTNRSMFLGAITVNKGVELSGNNVYVDSYDSTDPLYSTEGAYDPAKRKDNGLIATNDGITDSLNLGNADIFGKVATAPGGSVITGPNGGVGSIAWRAAGNNGVQPGWETHDYNLPMITVPPPSISTVAPSGGVIGGVTYDYILTDGAWEVGDLKGSVLVTGKATLVVKGNVDLNGSSDFLQVQNGASLKMWALGENSRISANSIRNKTGIPDALHYYGGPNHTSIEANGAFKVDFVLFAPYADFQVGGGGSNTKINISGAIVANSVKLTGRVDMHFDESLKGKYTSGVLINSWTEL